MANGERNTSKELTLEDWQSYRRMYRDANTAHRYLETSRRYGVDERRTLERMALWQGVLVDQACAQALEPGHFLLLWPPGVSTETRYGLQAAIRTVHAMMPFTQDERQSLVEPIETVLGQAPTTNRNEVDVTVDDPELLERWHAWLRTDEFGLVQHSRGIAVGPSTVLEEGYKVLAAHLDYILADPMADPM
jgi:hypothetical protein